ncbi:SDR family NAD(P)-dependent oxidoreductase [Paenibacillus cymbidii]|uniref:SDR family NAD(P)-dependent oxidoreductase n=1 Tax=Paenibacillus cymbidii TaxID=1639034 RepID=UPI0010822139|nr:SDR family NAD(P)-dependent oxidoreductase [Paenibacillus cymbidii]
MKEARTVVITGAAQGLGLAMAHRFAKQGDAVVVADLNEAKGEEVCRELRAQGASASFVQVDVCSKTSVDRLVERTVETCGSIDVMINNAGLAIIGPSEDVTEEEWDKSIDVMQKGVFFGCQAAGRAMMRQQRGIILNTSSINASVAFPMRLAYCAAKAAVSMMTKVLALEWAPHGIRVNAVAPGVSQTEMLTKAIAEGVVDTEGYLRRIPMRRFGEPKEIADACAFLCSDEATYITGEVLTVDGGWSVNGFK